MNKWWEKLTEQMELSRIVINNLLNESFLKIMKLIIITTILSFAAIFLSLFQPVYVADRLIIIWLVVTTLLAGWAIGVSHSSSKTEEVFEAIANSKNNKITLKNGVTVYYNKSENKSVWSTVEIDEMLEN